MLGRERPPQGEVLSVVATNLHRYNLWTFYNHIITFPSLNRVAIFLKKYFDNAMSPSQLYNFKTDGHFECLLFSPILFGNYYSK